MKTLEYAHKATDLKVGEWYLVAHAEFKWPYGDNPIQYIPIIPHLHSDPQFSTSPEHYHIDGRFTISDFSRRQWGVDKDGFTNRVFWPNWPNEAIEYTFLKIVYKRKKCIRLTNGLFKPNAIKVYSDWYDTMIGKSCKGKKCPHYGTNMQEINGQLVCPMHNLVGDLKTETIINH